MKDELKVELAWCMKEVAERNLGKIDYEAIAQELIDRNYIRQVTPEQRKQIRHDFKRIANGQRGIADALDKLFTDILMIMKEDDD